MRRKYNNKKRGCKRKSKKIIISTETTLKSRLERKISGKGDL